MKKAMLSQPMAGKTDEEIVTTREKAIAVLRDKGYEVVNPCSPMNGTARKLWKAVEWCRSPCASWQSRWKT